MTDQRALDSALTLVASSLMWLAFAGCQTAQPAAASAKPVAVRAVPVEWATHSQPLRTVGTLAGKMEVKLSFKSGGLVEKVMVEEGAAVRAGQPLAVLKLPEVNAAVTQTRHGYEKSRRDFERVKSLYDGNAATLEQLQDATTQLEVARAGLDSATFNEEHATIVAPTRGKILRRLVENDELVAPGAPVLLFRSSARGWVLRVAVTDRQVVKLALGDAASVTFNAFPGRAFNAQVSEIAEGATMGTGAYEVELSISAADAPLRSGLVGRAVITPSATTRHAFIPLEALQEGDGDNATVYVPDSNGQHASRRSVTIAFIQGDRVAIAEGLEGVRTVVTDGAARLSPGSSLQVVASANSANGAP
jgi:multidrug efflux system membrane fusion protein